MKLVIEINCDGDAIQCDGPAEIERILVDRCERLPAPVPSAGHSYTDFILRDVNGNWVGRARFEEQN